MYPKTFISKIIDAAGEAGETQVWLNFSLDCGYMTKEKFDYFIKGYDEVNRMLFGMVEKPDRFVLKISKK